MTKVLVIEDDQMLRSMYEKKLSAEGYQVLVAIDGRAGLTLINNEKPDLVLLDIMLPGGMNGFDVLEELKKDEQTKDLPVLMLTNLDSEAKVAKEIGASGYLIKANTRPSEVIATIKGLLSSR